MAEQERPVRRERTQLGDLVRHRKDELGLSYERLAHRAVDPENGKRTVTSSWLHRLVNRMPVVPPDLSQLRAIAAAIEVPLGRVQDAAGSQFFGIDTVWSTSGQARALVERADRLTETQLEQLMRLLDAFADGDS